MNVRNIFHPSSSPSPTPNSNSQSITSTPTPTKQYSGTLTCPTCSQPTITYREHLLPSGPDLLHFEQTITTKNRKDAKEPTNILTIETSFNDEVARWDTLVKSGTEIDVLQRGKNAKGKAYDLLHESSCVNLKCISCAHETALYDRVVRYDGSNEVNWMLCPKNLKMWEGEGSEEYDDFEDEEQILKKGGEKEEKGGKDGKGPTVVGKMGWIMG